MTKDFATTIRLDQLQREKLARMAADAQVSEAEVIRMLLDQGVRVEKRMILANTPAATPATKKK